MKNKKTILVTGAGGQLGSELQEISKKDATYSFLFSKIFGDYSILDITNEDAIDIYFKNNAIDFCINTAAYTAVDAAETHEDIARKVNVDGVRNLARACKKYDAVFFHISTDFVFDGSQSTSYSEEDVPRPLSVYGKTKLESEKCAIEECKQTVILRTAWLYSCFGKNFMKTILEKGAERGKLSVVADQIGTPTYAADLAEVLMKIIRIYDITPSDERKMVCGIYHYTNEGIASWYDFAQSIVEYGGIECELIPTPTPTQEYSLSARRPAFSVLNKKKIRDRFEIIIPHWRESLKKCIARLE